MAFPEQQNPLKALTGFTAGGRLTAFMRNAVRTLRVRVTVAADVVVSVAGTGIRNRGSVVAALSELGIVENGVERWNGDPRMLAHFAQFYSAGRRSGGRRLTAAEAAAPATYALRETFDLVLAPTNIASPTEAAFMEADTRQALEFFATMASNAAARIVAGGTVAVNNLTVTAQQILDDKIGDDVVVIPTCRKIIHNINAANTQEQVFIRSSRYLRGLLISQDSDAGEIGDAITSIAIRGDERDIIGPQQAPWADLVDGQYAQAGGEVDGTDAHLFVPMIRHGRLSTMYNPSTDRNLRIEANVQPSVTSGATNAKLVVHIFEMERVAGLTVDPMPFPA